MEQQFLFDALFRWLGAEGLTVTITTAIITVGGFRLLAGALVSGLRAAGRDNAAERIDDVLEATDSIAAFLNPFSAYSLGKLKGRKK
jgi:hypothetical protein